MAFGFKYLDKEKTVNFRTAFIPACSFVTRGRAAANTQKFRIGLNVNWLNLGNYSTSGTSGTSGTTVSGGGNYTWVG